VSDYEIDNANVVKLARNLYPDWLKQRNFALEMNNWTGPKPPMPALPKDATDEYKALQAHSTTPWLRRVINALVEVLIVEDHRPEDATDSSKAWQQYWRPNGLSLREKAVYRAALKHGQSYVSVVDGVSPLTDDPTPVIRGHSATRMTAFYRNDGQDEFPMYALLGNKIDHIDENGDETEVWEFDLYDRTYIHHLEAKDEGDSVPEFESWTVRGKTAHGGRGVVCPIVRFVDEIDNEGRVDGHVEPFRNVAARINQSTFDRLVVQRFGAWRVRWATGLTKPETDAKQRAAQLELIQSDFLVSSSTDTKFGTLEASSLDGYIRAHDTDLKDLAGVSQIPPHHLLGLAPNLSAEALAAAESSQMRLIGGIKTSFGESWDQTFRLAAFISGDLSGAADYGSKVIWRDVESRSMAQIADALGKLAAALKIPVQMLWERIPGWTSDDTERAMKLLEEQENLDVLKALAESAQQQPAPGKEPGRPPTGEGGDGE
jgi:hypothetical protein